MTWDQSRMVNSIISMEALLPRLPQLLSSEIRISDAEQFTEKTGWR